MTGTDATSRSSTSTPAALTPAMNARFSIRAARLESRDMMTVEPFFRLLAQAIATLALSSGVMSTLARPATPSRPKRLRAPRDSQTIDELIVAPASTVLNGYTFTPAPITAFSPMKHSSPSTEPSSQRALRRRSLARPTTAPRSRTPSAR